MTADSLSPVVRDDASAAFFDGTADGVLLVRRCRDCGNLRGPEVPHCNACLSDAFEWTPSSGTGYLESWVVLHTRAGADGAIPSPRVVATVELAEGPWMTGALLGVLPDAIVGRMAVVVAFERPEGSEAIPVFRPATAA
jgi:uncharacterized protein